MSSNNSAQNTGDQIAPYGVSKSRATMPLPELQPQYLAPASSPLTKVRQNRGRLFSGIAVAGALALGIVMGSFAVGGVLSTGGVNTALAASIAAPPASAPVAPAQAQTRTFSNNVSAASSQVITPTTTPGTTDQETPETKVGAEATITATITQQQAEQTAVAAAPGSTVDHTSLQDQNGVPVYDVDFTNGGGVLVNGDTGVVITIEAAGTDQGGHGGHGKGQDQAALAALATVTQAQAEAAALAASPGNTVDHSSLAQENGVVYWDVDFANGGGVKIDANTTAVITIEAAGTDQGGHGGHGQRD